MFSYWFHFFVLRNKIGVRSYKLLVKLSIILFSKINSHDTIWKRKICSLIIWLIKSICLSLKWTAIQTLFYIRLQQNIVSGQKNDLTPRAREVFWGRYNAFHYQANELAQAYFLNDTLMKVTTPNFQ